VDHGVEAADERVAAGKDPVAKISLAVRRAPDGPLVVEVADDGRGLDLGALAAAARRKGAAVERPEDALFLDGVSTREVVTDLSGRGVGMGAVRDVCLRAGGTVHVESVPGAGTRFRFQFPWPGTVP